MLNLKSSKIQALGLVLAVGLPTFATLPGLAEESTNTTSSQVKVEESTRLAMKAPAVSTQKAEGQPIIDPALERKLRKEVSSYYADLPLSAY
jgi:hypothetical protein